MFGVLRFERLQLTCNATDLYMSDEDMLACFGDATVCVFAADYAEVSERSNGDSGS